MSDEKKTVVDLRSYFPKFERKLVWVDGVEYSIREIDDLSEAEFHSMLEEEQRLGEMSGGERVATLKRHLQSMLVKPIERSISAPKDGLVIDVEGAAPCDLNPGDIVFLTNGLYVERNIVEDVSTAIVVKECWRFGASSASARLYRGIRVEALSDPNMSQKQLMIAIATVKNPPSDEDTDRPLGAASGSTP